ncbi:MAG: guanylate kinase [Sedimentisphaerales bacterium]|nr:guanylate kinase [Sedimentisphaerales bacterium]
MKQSGGSDNVGRLFVISGPSGSGKSTLTRAAIKRTGAYLSVSATTRQAGANEQDGKDYFFLTNEEFEKKIQEDQFLEYARVFDHYYGTPAENVKEKLAQGRTVLLEIDVQGAVQVFEKFPDAIGILVLPPDSVELRGRLENRKRDKSEVIEKRLKKAQWEIEQARSGGRYKHTIVNDDLHEAIEKLVNLITGR